MVSNPFAAKAAEPARIVQLNSREGGEFEAAMAKKIFGSSLTISPKNRRVREQVRKILISRNANR